MTIHLLESETYEDDSELIWKFLDEINHPSNMNKAVDFDLETHTFGGFPTSKRDAIIALGYRVHDLPPEVELTRNTQILHGYNIMGFDLRYLIDRMVVNNIDPIELGNGNLNWGEKRPTYMLNIKRMIDHVRSDNRLFFDSYIVGSARDQRLFHLKGRSLEEVAENYDPELEIVRMPPYKYMNFRALHGTQELRDYLMSDMRCTKLMWDVYFRNKVAVGNILDIPLEGYVYMSESYPGMTVCKQACEKTGIRFRGTNVERYGQIQKEAAVTDILMPGMYPNGVNHADVSSMYPSLAIKFNISPETTRFVKHTPYTGQFRYSVSDDGVAHFVIPDTRNYSDWHIDVDQNYEGEIPRFFSELYAGRMKIKEEMKTIERGCEEYNRFYSQEGGIKITMNSTTGYLATDYARYADLCQYILIVGLGRHLIRYVMGCIEFMQMDQMPEENPAQWFREHHLRFMNMADKDRYNLFKEVVGVDTDGFYTWRKYDKKTIQDFVDMWVAEFPGLISEHPIRMDVDFYPWAYFRDTKGKHYVLMDDKEFIFKGGSFKNRQLPLLFDEFLRVMTKLKADRNHKDIKDVYYRYKRFYQKIDLDTFSCRVTVKDKKDYANPSCLSMKIIDQVEPTYGVPAEDGKQYSYIHGSDGPRLVHPEDRVIRKNSRIWIERNNEVQYSIDLKWYGSNVIDTVIDRLDLWAPIKGQQTDITGYS